MSAHPSELALERLLADPEKSPAKAHVAGCDRCGARLAEMRRQGEEFLQFVFPATVEKVEEAARRRSGALGFIQWLAPATALAAAAAVFLLVRPAGDLTGYLDGGDTATKGEHGLGMSVFLNGSGGARVAREAEVVPANAAIRFRVRPPAACHLWIVSVDAAGQVSRLFPTQGDGGAMLASAFDLPGGAVLDGKPGPERVIAICTAGPLYYAAVERAVQATMARGEAAVRGIRAVRGLPEGTSQASILLEKR
jgi:hypothetical protein